MVGAHLRTLPIVTEVDCFDLGALNATWKQVCDVLIRPYDVVAVFNDYDGVDGLERFIDYAKRLQPDAKLITFGRGSKQVPGLFAGLRLDAVAASGDYESCVEDFVRYLAGEGPPAGVSVQVDGAFLPATPGRLIDPEEWALPDVDEIPYAAYDRMYADDLNKFCGIPGRRELVVPVARGCPINCGFCDVPAMQGLRERRLSVDRTITYIRDAYARRPFEYVSFYAPTFTLNKPWVGDLCRALRSLSWEIRWKCVTTMSHLTEDLIMEMGRAGCVRISVGIETIGRVAGQHLPSPKRNPEARLPELAAACRASGIELNAFVILGLPDDTPDDAERTIRLVRRFGARLRPTIFTPYDRMRDDMGTAGFRAYNRQLFVDGTVSPADAMRYYRLCYADDQDRPTSVMDGIPARGSGAADATSDASLTSLADPVSQWRAEPTMAGFDIEAFINPALLSVEPHRKRDYDGYLNLSNNTLHSARARALLGRFLASWQPKISYPYPPGSVRRIAERLALAPEECLLLPGSDAAIKLLLDTVGAPGRRLIIPWPNYENYDVYGRLAGWRIAKVPHRGVPTADLVDAMVALAEAHPCAVCALANPNGFTGAALPIGEVERLASAVAGHRGLLVIDEAYAAFARLDHMKLQRDGMGNVAIIRSYSKSLGTANLRIAVLSAPPRLVEALARARPMNSVSGLASEYLIHCLDHPDEMERILDDVRRARAELIRGIRSVRPDWTAHDSEGNFVLVDLGDPDAPDAVVREMAGQGILIKDLSHEAGFASCVRITIPDLEDLPVVGQALSRCGSPARGASL
jgi:histidinol-phosphate/aromatic aminotransferase/cobyric acid decarboxylase-like protein